MTPEQEAELFGYVGRHLVAIGAVFVFLDATGKPTGQQQSVVFSGFVVEVDGSWYVITAGHILGRKYSFGDLIRRNQIQVTDCKFVDFLGRDAKIDAPTPFSWEAIEKHHVDDDALGLDIGLFRLRDLYVAGLSSNGVGALAEQNWIDGDADGAQKFMVFGFPAEEVTREDVGNITTEYARTCVAGITPCAKPANAPSTVYPQFFGTIISHEPNSMVGFSGGPIMRWKQEDGKVYYWVHAIQSAWFPDTRVTIGCPMTLVAEAIRKQWPTSSV